MIDRRKDGRIDRWKEGRLHHCSNLSDSLVLTEVIFTRETEQKNKHFNKHGFIKLCFYVRWCCSTRSGRGQPEVTLQVEPVWVVACTSNVVRSGTFTPGLKYDNSPALTRRKKSVLPGRWRSAEAAFSTTNSQR